MSVYLYTVLNFIGLYLEYLTLLLASHLKVNDIRGKFLDWYFVLISVAIPDNYATISMLYWGNLPLQNFGHFPEVYIYKSLYFRPFQCKDILDLYCINQKEYKKKFVVIQMLQFIWFTYKKNQCYAVSIIPWIYYQMLVFRFWNI